MTTKSPATRVVAKALEMPEVKALLKIFRTDRQFSIKLSDLRLEVINLHTTRPIRRLTVKSLHKSAQAILEANLVDQQTRSTLVERAMTLRRLQSTLTANLDRVQDLVLLKYSSSLSQVRSKDERTRYIRIALFPEILKFMEDVEATCEQIEAVIEDIDQASYYLQRLTNVMEAVAPGRARER